MLRLELIEDSSKVGTNSWFVWVGLSYAAVTVTYRQQCLPQLWWLGQSHHSHLKPAPSSTILNHLTPYFPIFSPFSPHISIQSPGPLSPKVTVEPVSPVSPPRSCEAIDGYGGRSLWNEAGVLRRNSRHDAVQRLWLGAAKTGSRDQWRDERISPSGAFQKWGIPQKTIIGLNSQIVGLDDFWGRLWLRKAPYDWGNHPTS